MRSAVLAVRLTTVSLDVLKDVDKKLGHLPEPEKTQIKSLLDNFTAIFPDAPRMTTAAVHHVDVGDVTPIK